MNTKMFNLVFNLLGTRNREYYKLPALRAAEKRYEQV